MIKNPTRCSPGHTPQGTYLRLVICLTRHQYPSKLQSRGRILDSTICSAGCENAVMKTSIRLFEIFFALLCVARFPNARAVNPPPDGGYPGRNTAEGQKALFSLTTGGDNTALGYLSLQALTTGNLNTGVGAWTLALNTADYNTACGAAALLFNGFGTDNTAIGTAALLFNTTGEGNTATGAFALYSNNAGDFNTANGEFALYFNNAGERNTAMGNSALYLNTGGSRNTAIGNTALLNNTTGQDNTATGAQALMSNTTGSFNLANGFGALSHNTISDSNTAIGYQALLLNTTGNGNTAVGAIALENCTGTGSTAVGITAGFNVASANNVICIGHSGADVSNSCFIGNIRGVTTVNADAIPVVIDSGGQLGTMSSSRRFKKEIKPMDRASEAIHALKPVTFHYNSDTKETPQFGLIAEEVAEIDPDLVVRDKNGEIYTVRYDAVNAMLLNEFLKEHRKVQEQAETIAQLKFTLANKETIDAHQQKQIEALTAGLQKVSAHLEASRPAPQVVKNNQ